jgi:hypothetical protein
MYDRSHLWACCGTPARLYFCICSQRTQKDFGLLNSISHHSKRKKEKKRERDRERERQGERETGRERNFAKKRKSGTNEV